MERIQKVIAASGLASRRQAEQFLKEGRVKINGKVVTEPGTKIDPALDKILLNNRTIPTVPSITYAIYKSKGVVCSRNRQGNEKIITDLVPHFPVVYPIGRLDKESEGLLLLTNEGELAQKLTHPSFLHKKEYELIVKSKKANQEITPEWFCNQFLKGVKLGDGLAKADEVIMRALKSTPGLFNLKLTVHEGRKHLLRRMCAVLDLDVISLRRIRIANLALGNLKVGEYRILSKDELKELI